MNNFDKISYSITGIAGLVTGGSLLGLSKVNKLQSDKKLLKIVGVLLAGIGMIFTSLFVDANLYPEFDEEEEITEE